MEVWKPCVGFENYQVSSLGRVRSVKTGRVLKAADNWHGYLCVSLYHGKEAKTVRVHRLVARSFHGDNGPSVTVNHKNGIKTDNRACNLEWCSQSENRKHAIQNGLVPRQTRGSVYAT